MISFLCSELVNVIGLSSDIALLISLILRVDKPDIFSIFLLLKSIKFFKDSSFILDFFSKNTVYFISKGIIFNFRLVSIFMFFSITQSEYNVKGFKKKNLLPCYFFYKKQPST